MSHPVAPSVARQWLRLYAVGVRRRLWKRELPSLRLSHAPTIHVAPFTDGWYASIGTLDIAGTDEVCLFLDDIASEGQLRPSACLFVQGVSRAETMARRLAPHLGRFHRMGNDSFRVVRGHTYMARSLPAKLIESQIVEIFDGTLKDLCMYFPSGEPWDQPPSATLIEKTARFLRQVIATLETFQNVGTHIPAPKAVTLRAAMVSKRIIQRDSRQARDAKRRDHYTCRICDDRPEHKYGEDGRACLEAHHIDGVHGSRGRVSKLDRIITVCANCHRVLGKLSPDERGFRELRRRFRRQRADRSA